MSRRVNTGVRAFGAALFAAAAWLSVPVMAQAQTTVVLDSPGAESVDTMIQGGSSASANFDGDPLATRASDDAEYERRVLLKFDTQTRIPAKAPITSAKLTLTVKGGNSETRKLAAYRLVYSFEDDVATWKTRKRGHKWKASGGDFGGKYAEATVTAAAGSKVTFDVTRLVQEIVNSKYESSRWTRIAVLDPGSTSRDSYREYYPSETGDASVRPTLTVVYGGSAPVPPRADQVEEEEAAPAPSSGSTSTLRVLHWNLHHGNDPNNRWAFPLQMEVIRKANPDVISLNEVEKFNSSYGNIDQAAEIAEYLKAKTGKTWYQYMRVGSGSSKGIGNAVLSRFPITSTSYCQLSGSRNAVHMGVVVNGRTLNLWSTHLAVESGSYRLAEANALVACMGNYAQQRVVAGDFNAQAGSTELRVMTSDYVDVWAKAKSMGATTNYSGNCDGCTRNSRIDYVFTSKDASSLVLKSAQIIDSRDSSGKMPSDHKPMLTVYSVK
jgi:endonuclease/exonuclease/phosphatase family metal-dependent hydrolase